MAVVVTKTFKCTVDGQSAFGGSGELTGTGATSSAAEAQISAAIDTARNNANAASAKLDAAHAAYHS